MNSVFLSYILDKDTPTYGNRNNFSIEKESAIYNGDIVNDSSINSTVHIGTHIDMPYHFYEDGQTIEDYQIDFWRFEKVLFLNINPKDIIVKDEIIEKLEKIDDIGYEILVIKTGICDIRYTEKFWSENYGFHPDIYDYLISKFPNIRILGFDSISVSSFAHRMLGREAHKRFLNPQRPILLLEDMDLQIVDENTNFKEILVSPLRIANCDGLPCTVFGVIDD